MSVMDFVDGPVPADVAPGEGTLTCSVCGVSFNHEGRGRKPKTCPEHRNSKAGATTTSTPRRSTKDVESAIAVLDGMYSATQLGLMMFSPNAAMVWTGQLDTLQKQNRVTLAGDPNLCKSICRMGERTGKAAFFLSHVMALAPVVMILREDITEARRNRPAKVETAAPGYPEPENVENDFVPVPDNAMRFFG